METLLLVIVIALGIYVLGLIIYSYRQITRDRFYEQRDARRQARVFKTAGRFVPKKNTTESKDK